MISTTLLLLALATSAQDASAPSQAAATQLEGLEVAGVRNPQVFDIKKGVEVRERFRAIDPAQRDALALSYYLVSKGKHAQSDLSQIQLGVDTTQGYLDVTAHPHGRIELPEVPANLVEQSELFSDQPRRSLEIIYKIDIAADSADAISVERAQRGVSQARAAWKAVLPGMARATVPKFNCVEFQFAGPGQALATVTAGESVDLGAGESVKVPLADIPANASSLFWTGDLVRIAACKA